MKPSFLKETKGGLLINESDIETLKKYGIDVDKYKDINTLLYEIDNIINDGEIETEEQDELDYIASTIQERNYYLNYKK